MNEKDWTKTLAAIRGASVRWAHDGGMSYTRIAKESGLDLSAVSRALVHGWATERTKTLLTQWWVGKGQI